MPALSLRRRILLVSLVSTTLEFYSFFIYATAAAVVLGPLYFPSDSELAQTLGTWGSFALAFVARPVGAALFGHIGDRVGTRSALAGAMILMGVCTFAIGLLPTHSTIGWMAPVLLCLLRFGQGLGLGGQWGGAVLMAAEDAPPSRQGLYAMIPQLGAPLSFMLANGLFLVLGAFLTPQSFVDWGWRVPFLLSMPLMGIGIFVRHWLITPTANAESVSSRSGSVPLADLLRHNIAATALGTLGVTACFVLYYLTTAFALGYATSIVGHSRQEFLAVQICAMPFMALATLLSGRLIGIAGQRVVLLSGTLATIAVGLLLGPALQGTWDLHSAVYLCAALMVLGLMYGTLGSWLPTLFPVELRYTGTSIAFNVAGVLGGALTPLLATYLTHVAGLSAVGYYVAFAGVVSSLAVLASSRLQLPRMPVRMADDPALDATGRT